MRTDGRSTRNTVHCLQSHIRSEAVVKMLFPGTRFNKLALPSKISSGRHSNAYVVWSVDRLQICQQSFELISVECVVFGCFETSK